MKNHIRIVSLLAACGLAGVANSQPYEVTISGATLLENFLVAPASTNDFIDLDGDGVAGSVNLNNEQLANTGNSISNAQNSDYFIIQYTAVGSGNGIADLDSRGWSRKHVSGFTDGITNYLRGVDDESFLTMDNPYSGVMGNIQGDDSFVSSNVSDGFMNRVRFIQGGARVGLANPNTPRGYPFRTDVAGGELPSTSTNDATHGVQIDLAPTDVPVAWFITQVGMGDFDAFPNTTGYGNNPVISLNADGTPAGESNKLKTLVNTNTNTAAPDQNTIYSTQFTTAVVGSLVNYGVGYSQVDMSSLRHGFATGRLKSGENLTFVTRDSGSGTRNAFNNGICLDPSFGIGENIGLETSSSANDLIGPNYRPSNKGGSSRMDATVRNTRLGVGYTGAERLFNSGYKTANNGSGQMDMLAIRNDIFGTAGATYNRPNIDNVLNNDRDTGYVVQAPSDIASIGDPRNETMPGGIPGNTNPPMANPAAAGYLNNIRAAVASFSGDPGTPEDFFSPGEFLAFNFIPTDATDYIPGNGTCDPIINATNVTLQNFVAATNVLGNPVYDSFDSTARGRVPVRTTGVVYADGVANGANYISESGAVVSYSTTISSRNKIQGDFNADGLRNWNDMADMVDAWEERAAVGPAWSPASGVVGSGSDFVLDLTGDFNGDGNFDIVDVRYFADGLALDPSTGLLNRAQGFLLADNASATGNAFGTALATGASYTAGASAADIAGSTGTTPGFAPVGADGVIGAADLDYIYAQFADLPGSELDWSNTDAVSTANRLGLVRDLSADVNGDLLVNQDDVCATLAFLGTSTGDVNLDGVVNATDSSIASGNLGMPGGWADGDVNGDGTVTQSDLDIITGAASDPCSTGRDCCDQNNSGTCDPADFSAWIANFNSGNPLADVNQDGSVSPADFSAWIAAFNASQAGTPLNCN